MMKLVVLTCLMAAVSARIIYPVERTNVFGAGSILGYSNPSTYINAEVPDSGIHLLNKRYVITSVVGNRVATPLAAPAETFAARYHAAHFNPVPYGPNF